MTKSIVVYAFLILTLGISLTGCASKPVKKKPSMLSYTSHKLKLMDIDDMVEIVEDRLTEYKQKRDPAKLTEAVTICLSRPNDDNLLERLLGSVRYILDSTDQWEEAVENVVEDGLRALKMETTAAADQVTYVVVLQNVLLENKAEILKQDEPPQFERAIIDRIAEADLVVSEEAQKYSGLNLMEGLISPSDMAKNIIEELNQKAFKK